MNHAAAARFLLAVCVLVLLFSGGARFAIGLLLHPMAHDLSWSRSTLSLSVTVFMVLSACALPVVAHLVNRFGARAVLAVSVLATALALAAMSFIESPWEALLICGLITMAHHVAGGIGALAGASIFDAYGSYTQAFVAMLVLSVVALGLTLVLPRRPRQPLRA